MSPFAVPAPAVTVQRTGPVGSKGACPALKKHFPPAKGKETRRWWWWWGDRRKPPPLRGTRTAVTPTTPKASSPPQSQPAPPRPPYHLQLPPRACALRAPSPAHAQKCVSLSSPPSPRDYHSNEDARPPSTAGSYRFPRLVGGSQRLAGELHRDGQGARPRAAIARRESHSERPGSARPRSRPRPAGTVRERPALPPSRNQSRR